MPAQKPQWFFQPRSHRNGAGTGDGDTAPGLTSLPAAMLRRHGARVLDPEKAAAVHGFQPPRSTVYRARTLLVPGDVLQDAPKVRAINEVLADVGMRLIPPSPEAPPRLRDAELARKLAQLPRVAILAPARDNAIPVVVDAWVALQALRAAATAPRHKQLAESPWTRPTSSRSRSSTCWSVRPSTAARSATPAAALTGGRTAAAASPGRAAPTRTCTAAATRAARSRSCSTRRTAGRRPSARTTTDGGPVVAVLDTGVRAHPWLDVERTSGRLQPGSGRQRRRFHVGRPRHPEGHPRGGQEGGGEGRQAAPADQAPVGHADHGGPAGRRARLGLGPLHVHLGHRAPGRARRPGAGHADHAQRRHRLRGRPRLCALRHLVDPDRARRGGRPGSRWSTWSRCRSATSTRPRADAKPSPPGCGRSIEVLLGLGVIVVAAAGNYSTSRRFYPAAFATKTPPGPGAADQRGRAQPERLQGDLQRRRPLGHRLGLRRGRGQHAAGGHQRQPQPRAQAARAPGQPHATGHLAAGQPRVPRSGRLLRRLRGLERHLVLGSAAGRADHPGADGGSEAGSGLELDALRAAGHDRTGRWPP